MDRRTNDLSAVVRVILRTSAIYKAVIEELMDLKEEVQSLELSPSVKLTLIDDLDNKIEFYHKIILEGEAHLKKHNIIK